MPQQNYVWMTPEEFRYYCLLDAVRALEGRNKEVLMEVSTKAMESILGAYKGWKCEYTHERQELDGEKVLVFHQYCKIRRTKTE